MATPCGSSDALEMATSHWWQRCSTPITPHNPFKQDLDDVSQFFVRSEVKSNPFCSDSGFAEPTTPPVSDICRLQTLQSAVCSLQMSDTATPPVNRQSQFNRPTLSVATKPCQTMRSLQNFRPTEESENQ